MPYQDKILEVAQDLGGSFLNEKDPDKRKALQKAMINRFYYYAHISIYKLYTDGASPVLPEASLRETKKSDKKGRWFNRHDLIPDFLESNGLGGEAGMLREWKSRRNRADYDTPITNSLLDTRQKIALAAMALEQMVIDVKAANITSRTQWDSNKPDRYK